MAQAQNAGTQLPIAAVIKVDAHQANQLALRFNKERAGAQLLAVQRQSVVMQTVIRFFIAFIPQNAQCHVSHRRTDLPAADMVVGNGDNAAILSGQIVQRDLIIRTQNTAQKICQLHVLFQNRMYGIGHRAPLFSI